MTVNKGLEQIKMDQDANTSSLPPAAQEAIALIPSGAFVMTAAFDGRRAGVMVRHVQFCAAEPPLIAISMVRGQALEPLIRDSRAFALCQISADDRFLHRKFAANEGLPGTRQGESPDDDDAIDDPFVSIPVRPAPSGAPIIERALAWLDCELVRTVDLEPDHRLYVGRITDGGVLDATRSPAVIFGANGVK